MTPEFIPDIESGTVKHAPSGIVFRFTPHPDGGWTGVATDDTIYLARGFDAQTMAGMASRAGDAWIAAVDDATRGR